MHLSTLKLSIKVLLRRKFFTFVSLFGIAFTLIVLTVVAAMLGDLLRPAAPETRLDRMLLLNRADFESEDRSYSGSPGHGFIDRFFRDLPHVERMAAFSNPIDVVSFRDGQKIVSQLRRCDADYWEILEFDFLEGGPFSAEDVEAGRNLAVITDTTRRVYFGDGPAVGQDLHLGDREFRVVGVVRDPSFSRRTAVADVWTPVTTSPDPTWRTRSRFGFEAIFLLDRGGSKAAVQREVDARLRQATPEILGEGFETTSARLLSRLDEIALEFLGDPDTPHVIRRFVFLVAAAGLLFMLLPAMNLVNVNMSRIFERSSEIGVRKAFGASSHDLVAQFVFENIVLCLLGGAIGFVGAHLALSWLNRSSLIPRAEFGLDVPTFFVGLGLAVFFGVLSGLYPAWRMSRLHAVQALKGETR